MTLVRIHMAEDLFAFDTLDETLKRTKDLLWPVRWGIWLRLAVIAFFVGGGFSSPNFNYSTPAPQGMPGISPDILPLLVGVIALVLIVALVFWLVSTTVQFVFVDCLKTGEFSLARFFRERFGKGVRLFAFQVALILLLIIILAAAFLVGFGGAVIGAPNFLAIIGVILLLLPVILIFGLVMGLTIDFVVPIMIRDDSGVIAGWKRLWPIMASQAWQTIAYIVVRVILNIVAAIALIILILLAAIIIAIPFVLAGLAFYSASMFSPDWIMANLAAIIGLVVIYLIIFIPVSLLIQVPFVTFFRHYSLFVLGRLAPAYDLVRPSAPPAPE
jgi:hypothetical protein